MCLVGGGAVIQEGGMGVPVAPPVCWTCCYISLPGQQLAPREVWDGVGMRPSAVRERGGERG